MSLRGFCNLDNSKLSKTIPKTSRSDCCIKSLWSSESPSQPFHSSISIPTLVSKSATDIQYPGSISLASLNSMAALRFSTIADSNSPSFSVSFNSDISINYILLDMINTIIFAVGISYFDYYCPGEWQRWINDLFNNSLFSLNTPMVATTGNNAVSPIIRSLSDNLSILPIIYTV